MEGAGADLHVVGLQDHAALVGPIALQRQDQALERPLGTHVGGKIVAHGLGEKDRAGRGRPTGRSAGGSRTAPDAAIRRGDDDGAICHYARRVSD